MKQHEAIKIFEEKKVRTLWDEEAQEWYISIVDVIEILADSKDFQTARKYWNKLKQRLNEEGNETVTDCHQLKLKAHDGKMRFTDVADAEQLFRLIQSLILMCMISIKQSLSQHILLMELMEKAKKQ